MGVEIFEKEISRFLSTPEPEVLCIRGKWGVGKTYAWNFFLRAAQANNRIKLKNYSYVSLFGLLSLDQLKYAVFENSVPAKDVGLEPSLETFKSNIGPISWLWSKQLLPMLSSAPLLRNAAIPLQSAAFLAVRETIVCIDDLERKGNGLRVRDVLGLISLLKEKRKCKVVIILNEGELEKPDRDELEKFREKVVDENLEFAPSPSECIKIAITGDSPALKIVAETCVELEVSNIRIIKRMERLARRIEPIFTNLEPQVLGQAIQSLVVFCWALYGEGLGAIEFISTKLTGVRFGTNKEPLSEREKFWNAALNNIGFTSVDELDKSILDGIDRGYFDEAAIRKAAHEKNAEIVAAKSAGSLSVAWGLYHNTFDSNEDQFVDAVRKAIEENARFITPLNLNSSVRILREIGRDDMASYLIGVYLASRTDEPQEFFDLTSRPFPEPFDGEVVAEFGKRLAAFEDGRDPLAVIRKIADGAWKKEDVILLSRLTPEKYYEIFRGLRGDELSRLVNACTKFEEMGGASAEMIAMSQSAKEALRKIGLESPLNRLRVRRYGVRLD